MIRGTLICLKWLGRFDTNRWNSHQAWLPRLRCRNSVDDTCGFLRAPSKFLGRCFLHQTLIRCIRRGLFGRPDTDGSPRASLPPSLWRCAAKRVLSIAIALENNSQAYRARRKTSLNKQMPKPGMAYDSKALSTAIRPLHLI